MKLLITILAFILLASGSVVAGLYIFRDAPPPLDLSEAYPIAVKALGTNASQYRCVLAMPICSQNYYTNHLTGEWSFDFVNTNRAHKTVWVFFDDKTAAMPNIAGF